MEQIERIKEMEQSLDQALEAINELSTALDKYVLAQDAIHRLSVYLGSDEWRKDCEDDQAGKLPDELKRGVLSQDGIWNMLADNHGLNIQMLEIVTDALKNR